MLGAIGGALTGNVRTPQQEVDAAASDVQAAVPASVLATAETAGVAPDRSTATNVDWITSITQSVDPVDTRATEAATSVTDTATTISENPTSAHHVLDATLDGKWNLMKVNPIR